MQVHTDSSPEEIQALYDRLVAYDQAMPIVGVAIVRGVTADGAATCVGVQVHLDASARPDVADLARVHKDDGAGAGDWEAEVIPLLRLDEESVIAFLIQFSAPVACFVPIVLRLPRDRMLLLPLVQSGKLIIDTGPPRAGVFGLVDAFPATILALELDDGTRRLVATVMLAWEQAWAKTRPA